MKIYYQTTAKFPIDEFGDRSFEMRSEAVSIAADRESDYEESGGSTREIGFDCDTEAEAIKLKSRLEPLEKMGISSEIKRYSC